MKTAENSFFFSNSDWHLPRNGDRFFQVCQRVVRALIAYHRYEVEGMENIPRQGAALIAVNHSLATYDSILLGGEIYFQTGRHPAGLADRRIFQTPGLAQLFTRLGTIEGSPPTAEWLLRRKHLLMLAPGGMRESLRPSSQRYQINWNNRFGFARLAIKTQTPVILAACPAADDIFSVYENPLTPLVYQYLKWPFPLMRGLGLSLMPRPVKLIHRLSTPMVPPALISGEIREIDLKDFHSRLVSKMTELMQM